MMRVISLNFLCSSFHHLYFKYLSCVNTFLSKHAFLNKHVSFIPLLPRFLFISLTTFPRCRTTHGGCGRTATGPPGDTGTRWRRDRHGHGTSRGHRCALTARRSSYPAPHAAHAQPEPGGDAPHPLPAVRRLLSVHAGAGSNLRALLTATAEPGKMESPLEFLLSINAGHLAFQSLGHLILTV